MKKSSVSQPRKRLLERMQRVGHGRINNLLLRGHEPQWSPPPEVIRRVAIEKRRVTHSKGQQADFQLKDHVATLFEDFDHSPDGASYSIAIEDGLPAHFDVKEPDSD